MVSQSKTKALFSRDNVPPGGTCLSSFVVVLNGHSVLVGKMDRPEIWIERFLVGPSRAPVYAASGRYVLPARHLHWYESPLEAARSVLRDQVGLDVPESRISLVDVQSHVSGDVNDEKEPPHWDICFLYQTKVSKSLAAKLSRPQWFSELTFKPLGSLKQSDFTRGHGDVLQTAGLLRSRHKKSKGQASG
jgi:ADP-ribose pyrophosphatase YjhB (NUDIX family)